MRRERAQVRPSTSRRRLLLHRLTVRRVSGGDGRSSLGLAANEGEEASGAPFRSFPFRERLESVFELDLFCLGVIDVPVLFDEARILGERR